MKTTIQEHMLGFPMSLALSRARYLSHPSNRLHLSSSDDGFQSSIKKYNGKDCILDRLNKNGKKTDNIIHALREHVKLGAKISETVKGKLSLGARILRVGGVRKIYKKLFSMSEEEKLLKVSQCYLSTTAGPLPGLLFISTHKIAFCSDKSIKIASPNGDHIRIHYKVVIPKEKVMRVNESENVKKTSERYIQIETLDNFEFWFMGFLNYQSTFNSLQW
ncbi:putative GEM-like protein 8 [Cucumis sativus]|uniref:putative GEM-like protein 8 n=1 Tax=Cucumis sativus TaxID=3659 RepID=UPI0012F523B0|nr:putative GEM-like protein 8 [Cucumis sativus]